MNAANASALADTLSRERDHAQLFRQLATLRTDRALFDDVDELRFEAATPAFAALAARLDAAVTRGPEAIDTPIPGLGCYRIQVALSGSAPQVEES